MSEHKLIMPKQTGQLDAFIASLKLFYQSNKKGEDWYSNEEFKNQIKKELPYLRESAQDGAYLVKQSELVRYFHLAFYDYSTRIGRAHITQKGIEFYEAYLENNANLLIDIIMDSIFKNSFGRNNTAIKSSNSDIDPPKLFIKAVFDLKGIHGKGLAYLLYLTHNLQINYHDAIAELSKANNIEKEIPLEVSFKYSDVKFTTLLKSLKIIFQDSEGKYQLSEYVLNKYKDDIKKLSVYNKIPDITLTLNAIDKDNEIIENETEFKERVLKSFSYDTNSSSFKQQNNRTPQAIQKGNTIRYKTNPRISKTAIDLANYKCLFNETHSTFVSKLEKPFMEAHHLIPMAAQKDYSINIDRIENIVSLCPVCHSAIHLGNKASRLKLLKKLYKIKKPELENVGIKISFKELFMKYYT